jgi:hypothetical protein
MIRRGGKNMYNQINDSVSSLAGKAAKLADLNIESLTRGSLEEVMDWKQFDSLCGKYSLAKLYHPERLVTALYDLFMVSPESTYMLMTTDHKELALPVAEKVLSGQGIGSLLESKPISAYLVSVITGDEPAKELARRSLAKSSVVSAYHAGKIYDDPILRGYAKEQLVQDIFLD